MSQIPEEAAERVLGMIREIIEMDANGQCVQAEAFFRPLVDEFPQASLVHSYMCWILSRTGKHREAIEHGRVAIGLSPESELSSVMLFRALWIAGERALAFEEMKRRYQREAVITATPAVRSQITKPAFSSRPSVT